MKRNLTRVTMMVLLLAGLAWAQSPPPFTLLWKGKDLWKFGGGAFHGDPQDWQGMPGSVLAFQYEGKGPLPKPLEFVIPLEKTLPFGTYRLFVKNFYLGKMEATVGDITLPLSIRRYDW